MSGGRFSRGLWPEIIEHTHTLLQDWVIFNDFFSVYSRVGREWSSLEWMWEKSQYTKSMRISLKINEHAFGVESIKIKPIYRGWSGWSKGKEYTHYFFFGESGMCGNIRRERGDKETRRRALFTSHKNFQHFVSSHWRQRKEEELQRRIKSSGRMNEN